MKCIGCTVQYKMYTENYNNAPTTCLQQDWELNTSALPIAIKVVVPGI